MSPIVMAHAARRRVLELCPVFAEIPPEALDVIAAMMRVEEFRAGEVVVAAGEAADGILVVAAGELAVHVGAQPEPVRTLGPGALLGEYGVLAGRVRTATVRALGPTVALGLDAPRFRAFLLQFPTAALTLLRTAAERLLAAEARSAEAG